MLGAAPCVGTPRCHTDKGNPVAVMVWIDANGARSTLRVFGMTLLERLLRALAQAEVVAHEVRVVLPAGAEGQAVRDALPHDAETLYPLVFSVTTPDPLAGLRETVELAGDVPVLALSASTVVDTRALAHLAGDALGTVALVAGEGEQRGALLRLEGQDLRERGLLAPGAPAAETPGKVDLTALAEHLLAAGAAQTLEQSGFDSYIRNLRRDIEPWVLSVPNEPAREEVERFLFWSNYKGSTDFMTRYVYPPLVWRMVRPLARMRVHPNWVTVIDIVATVLAIPFFMAGMWLPGFCLSYLMSVLDSVDGKLARVTYTSSAIGTVMDHGLDIVHPPFWYLAWGYALASGDTEAIQFQMAVWMFWLYVADRICAPLFIWRTGRSIHGFEPFDEKMRTFISRRNVNLPAFTVAAAIDWSLGVDVVKNVTFALIVLWQAVCLVFHAVRVVQCWSSQAPATKAA